MNRDPSAAPQSEPDARVRRAWDLQYREPRESLALAQQVLGDPAVTAEAARTRAWAHLCIAYYRLRYDSPAVAGESLDAAAEILADVADARARVVLANGRARKMVMQGDADGAIRLFNDNLSSREPGIAPLDRCQALNGLAGCYWDKGDWSQSLAHSFEALNLMRDAGETHHLAALLNNVGVLLVTVGDFEAAQRLLREGIEIARDFRHPGLQQDLRAALIHCELDAGRAAAALPLVEEIRGFGEVAPESANAGEILHAVAEAFIANGRWAEAMIELARAMEIGVRYERPEVVAINNWLRGLMAYRRDDLTLAIDILTKAVWQLGKLTLPSITCRAYRVLADASADAGDYEKAYLYHRAFFQHHEARLGIASRAHYHALTIRHELAQAREAAFRDGLTGLYNRHYLNSMLDKLIALAHRQGSPLCIVMIDLDHFKKVNDQHGHDAGDAVLIQLARLLRESVRASDVACRFGGEEFCLILPDTTLDEAQHKVRQVLVTWQQAAIDIGSGRLDSLSFSAGVARLGDGDRLAAQLLKRADDGLYAAKRGGRGRVEIIR